MGDFFHLQDTPIGGAAHLEHGLGAVHVGGHLIGILPRPSGRDHMVGQPGDSLQGALIALIQRSGGGGGNFLRTFRFLSRHVDRFRTSQKPLASRLAFAFPSKTLPGNPSSLEEIRVNLQAPAENLRRGKPSRSAQLGRRTRDRGLRIPPSIPITPTSRCDVPIRGDFLYGLRNRLPLIWDGERSLAAFLLR